MAIDVNTRDAFVLNPNRQQQAIRINASGDVPASTSVGGAVLIENSNSTGAGLVIFSSQGASQLGRLLALRITNPAFAQAALSINYMGTASALQIIRDNAASASNSRLIDMTDNNPADTTLGVSGNQTGRGTIKVTHNKPDGQADANASAISIFMSRENAGEISAAHGLYIDGDHVVTGTLIDVRNNGVQKFFQDDTLHRVITGARFDGNIGFFNTAPVAKPTVSGAKGSNAALGSLMTALAGLGLVTDSTTA